MELMIKEMTNPAMITLEVGLCVSGTRTDPRRDGNVAAQIIAGIHSNRGRSRLIGIEPAYKRPTVDSIRRSGMSHMSATKTYSAMAIH